MRPQVTLALAGFGVVGGGDAPLVARTSGRCGSARRNIGSREMGVEPFRKSAVDVGPDVQQTSDWHDIVNDPEVDCVVELMGGTEPARSLVLAALEAGKHVVTANKAILSKHWNEIFGVAAKKRQLVYFEAAVGGGVPIVQALNEGLAGNRIKKIVGILNGTTNYILTRMQEEQLPYKAALRDAQKAGFAEADPTRCRRR